MTGIAGSGSVHPWRDRVAVGVIFGLCAGLIVGLLVRGVPGLFLGLACGALFGFIASLGADDQGDRRKDG